MNIDGRSKAAISITRPCSGRRTDSTHGTNAAEVQAHALASARTGEFPGPARLYGQSTRHRRRSAPDTEHGRAGRRRQPCVNAQCRLGGESRLHHRWLRRGRRRRASTWSWCRTGPSPGGWRPAATAAASLAIHPTIRQCPYYFVDDVAQAIAQGQGTRRGAHRRRGRGRRRRAGARPRPGGRGRDGRGAGGLRLGQAVLRAGRCPASARGPAPGDPGRPGTLICATGYGLSRGRGRRPGRPGPRRRSPPGPA